MSDQDQAPREALGAYALTEYAPEYVNGVVWLFDTKDKGARVGVQGQPVCLARDVHGLTAKTSALLALLREAVWKGSYGYDGNVSCCVFCGGISPDAVRPYVVHAYVVHAYGDYPDWHVGHREDCRFMALIYPPNETTATEPKEAPE